MNFESYKRILQRERDDDICLRPGKSYSLEFDIDDAASVDRLFMTGETAVFYGWKTEPDYQYLYRRLDDSLSSVEANRAKYALDMSADNFDYPKIAYHKIVWWPRFYGGGALWKAGISVKADGLKIHEGGYLHLLVEVRCRKPDVDKRVTYTEPDVTTVIDIPEGSYDWISLESAIPRINEPIGNVCIYLEGIHYSGKVFFEDPILRSAHSPNILHGFGTFTEDKPEFNWLGVNLSKVEWPKFEIKLNGEIIFDGEIFERCHRYSEWEFSIPVGLARCGKNTLEITHKSDYRDAAPYNLHELGIVSVRRDMLVWCPEVVSVGEEFSVLLKTGEDGVCFVLEDAPEYLSAVGELKCEKSGLNVLKFVCGKPENNVSFKLTSPCGEVVCNSARSVERADDGVITGTGDMVYINQNKRDFENYLSWYLSNDIGRLLTIRPTYRWCGSRSADGKLWRETADLLDSLGIKYVHMRDGRELPGVNANPTYDELASDSFHGRQNHELDGAYNYWGIRNITDKPNEQLFYDLYVRTFLQDGERMNPKFNPGSYIFKNGQVTIFRDLTVERDMEAIANSVVDALNKSRDGSTRHTGPATIFKYFYQAGYSWTGAELMYSSNEITCASLRGAAKVYGGTIGGHLATQWSTTPHDVPEHSKRYRLALYNSYIQGLHEINTEEGLWRMEEYFADHNRFSNACVDHLKEHKDFNRYVTTHSRSGEFYTPVAMINGRFDGWKMFGAKISLWGRMDMQYGDPENAWDMLDVFYPLSRHGSLYRHPCPTDKPVGFYSGTPMGGIDVMPIEAESFDDYKLLCAIGYNKALDEDMDKLEAYVKRGGRLFVGLAQMSVTTNRADIESLNLKYIDHNIVKTVAPQICFAEDSVNGQKVRVNTALPEDAEILQSTDGGNALIYKLKLGDGTVYLLNTLEYAGNPAIYSVVREFISSLANELFDEESTWARGDDKVNFAVFRQEDGSRHIYFLAIDWFDAACPVHTAALRLGDKEYPIDVKYGTMIKVVATDNVAAWFDSENNDVLSVSDGYVTVQGCEMGELFVAREGRVDKIEVDLTNESLQKIKI